MKMALLLSLFVGATSWANTDLNQKIDITLKNASGVEFIKEIAKLTKVSFAVQPGVQFPKKFSLQMKGVSLRTALDNFAREQHIAWAISDDDTIKISDTK